MPLAKAFDAWASMLILAAALLCSLQGNAEASDAGEHRVATRKHTMFAGRSVERLVPTSVLSKSQVVWACETSYRLIGPDMRVDNETLKAAVDQTWTKFNALPNLKIKMELSPPALAEGTEENLCRAEDDREDCFRLSDDLAANYGAIDIHVLSGVTRSTQFPEIGEKEWTYNRMLETSLRDRGVTGRIVSLRLKALPEGVHVMKYLPMTPLYAEETMFQLYGRELLPFDVTKQNALYASLDLIGLNNLAGVGWVEILSISEAWHWKPARGECGVANITIRTKRDRTGASMGENLMMQLPRLLDRLDELGLRRVDGEVLWSNVVTNQAPQDQIAGYLDPEDPVKSYDVRDPSSSIPSFPPKTELSAWWFIVTVASCTLAALLGGLIYTNSKSAQWPAKTAQPPSMPAPVSTLARLSVPLNTVNSGMVLRPILSNTSPGLNLPAFSSASPLTQHNSTCSETSSEALDTFNAFRRQRGKTNTDVDINALGDSATETAGMEGVSEARRRALIQAEFQKAHSLKGWEIPFDSITICQKEDGSDWLLGAGGFGEVYKGLRSGVQDVAIKVLTYSEELLMQQFWVEIELMKQLSFDGNIVQFYGCVIDTLNPILVLELMEGGDLRSALSGPMASINTWYNNGQVIAMDIVRGVFYLHNKNVIHGDLKSKNVLLSRNFATAKLSDVGMARVHASTVVTGELNQGQKGTFAYAAPELLLGQRCTEKADIFSLGVTLWEICTQDIPVRGRMRVLNVPEDCPQAISDLIDQCMRGEPCERPTAKEVFDALKRAEDPCLRTASSASSGAFPSKLSIQRMSNKAAPQEQRPSQA